MTDWHNIPNVRDHISWKQDKGRMKLNYFLSIIMIGMFLNGYDGTVISGLQAFDSWNADLGYPDGTKIGLLNACSQFSGLVVGPIIQYIDDTYGRKWGIRFYGYTLLAGSVIGCVAGVAGANGYALFVCGRVLIGFGLASFLMTSLAVVQEITHPRTRVLVAHSWDSYWILGAVVASWVNFGCSFITTSWQWRIPYIVQVVPAVYLLIAVQFVPETPRFMIGQGRYEEAFQFLVEYHGNGDPKDPLVLFEFEEMKEAIIREREAKAETWSQILKQPANRHRLGLAALFQFCTCLSGSSLIYYYYTVVFDLVGITGATTQTGINAGLSMFTWVCQIVFVWIGKRVGRRPIMLGIWPCLLIGLVGMCAASAVASRETAGKGVGVAGVVMVWFYLGAFNCSNPVLYSYPAEVQTFSMRSKGLLVWNTFNQFFGAYTSWVDSIALRKIGWKYYIVYMPLVVLQWILMYIYMVETKGYTLEEIAQAFDGSTANLVPSTPYETGMVEADSDSNHKSHMPSDSKDVYPTAV